jgi:hypothetical protein
VTWRSKCIRSAFSRTIIGGTKPSTHYFVTEFAIRFS